MQRQIDKREVAINKVKRTPIVIFLRSVLPFIVIIIIIVVSFLIGFWDVKRFEYDESKLDNVSTTKLDAYLADFVGRNIFTVTPNEIKSVLIKSNGFIKSVYVKEVLPSKLSIMIEEHVPLYIGYSTDRCLLFSDTGILISEICTDCKQECTINEDSLGKVFIESTSVIESEKRLIFFDEISKVQKVLGEFGYFINHVNIDNGIAEFIDDSGKIFVFDLSNDLETQLARMYAVGGKINEDLIQFSRLDLRFKRPVMDLK